MKTRKEKIKQELKEHWPCIANVAWIVILIIVGFALVGVCPASIIGAIFLGTIGLVFIKGEDW